MPEEKNLSAWKAWDIARSLAFALVIALLPQGVWTLLLDKNLMTGAALPWAPILIVIVLWLLWQYVTGKWWPRSTAEFRRIHARAIVPPSDVFGWALLAGGFSLIALTGAWIVIFQLVKVPGNPLPNFFGLPVLTAVLVIAVASCIGAITEEMGFRGYLQVTLEKYFSAPTAIIILAILVSPWHGVTQGFVWPVLLWYFFADLVFATMAYLCRSILPGIIVHLVGLAIFFSIIWPRDMYRLNIHMGSDIWFWIHVAQMAIFIPLALWALIRLARLREAVL